MFKDDDEDELSSKKVNDPVKSKERIRELQDEEDEKEFVQDGTNTKSEEQIEMEQLRSALWCNIAACQLKLVRNISASCFASANTLSSVTIQRSR